MVYLFFQTWIWLLIAAAMGLLVGWLIWGRSPSANCSGLQTALDECRRRCSELESQSRAAQGAAPAGAEPPDEKARLGFLDAPQGEPDDLKRISGVGTVLEKTLNELGIFHFRQIADFNKETIDWIDDYLSFSGRIERENWVGQAKKLADGESTEFSNRYDEDKD